jgi:hypothetical protein
MGQTQSATTWLSRPEAQCWHYCQSVSLDRSPNLRRGVAQLVRVDSSVERPLRSVDPLPESGVGSGGLRDWCGLDGLNVRKGLLGHLGSSPSEQVVRCRPGLGSESALDDAVPIDLGQRVPVEPPPGAAGGDLVGYPE